MGDVIKLGSLLDRVTFDGKRRAIRYRGFKTIPYDQVKQLRLRELITAYEELQLENAHPDVEKDRRDVELWVDLKSGGSEKLAEIGQGGLVLSSVHSAAGAIGVPVVTERAQLAPPPAA